MRNVNEQHAESLSAGDRLALWLANVAGSIGFFWCCLALTFLPCCWPASLAVVQFLSSGLLQLVLLPVILIAGNLSSRHADMRAEAHYRAEQQAEARTAVILTELRSLGRRLSNIEHAVGIAPVVKKQG